jgi:hypothetical protein
MAKAQASLGVRVVVFGFDATPETPANRALQVLTQRQGLIGAEPEARESLDSAAVRAIEEAGVRLEGARRNRAGRLHLVGLGDSTGGRGNRVLTAWYYATVPHAEVPRPAAWTAANRGVRLGAGDAAVLRAALEKLRTDSRYVGGAISLLGDVFTGDDLLRLYAALHGDLEGSERTFRRRVQELRDAGVLKPVRDSEVAALRQRVLRFRSPAGTGGRPPELLRYAGSGGDDEHLVVLRSRRGG